MFQVSLNGLPDAPSKKQKLSAVKNQFRKAEIAQRRKLLADRAAKEAEEKTGMAAILRPNTIRLSMSPKGTVLTFSEDLGTPKIFNSLACGYPAPREKCIEPNCTNGYKYRDSKSKLPLCSLHCYKAVQGNTGVLPAC